MCLKPHWKKCITETSHPSETPPWQDGNPSIPHTTPCWPYGCDRTRSPPACTHESGSGTASCVSQGTSPSHQAQSSSHHLAPCFLCSPPEAWGRSRGHLKSERIGKVHSANTAQSLNSSLDGCYNHSAGEDTCFLHSSWRLSQIWATLEVAILLARSYRHIQSVWGKRDVHKSCLIQVLPLLALRCPRTLPVFLHPKTEVPGQEQPADPEAFSSLSIKRLCSLARAFCSLQKYKCWLSNHCLD